jgi:endo-1,4-beta-mannosidase
MWQPKDNQLGRPFILGINYWPRKKAMYWWSDFDIGEVESEFDLIKETGFKLVRIFLLWEDWQPTPGSVSESALRDLEQVCRAAADRDLLLDVTFFTGHMSGPNWAPGWMLRWELPLPPRVNQVVSGGVAYNCGYANPFTDPVSLQAEELLLQVVVSSFKDHPAIGLWNLGNEPDLFAWPPDAQAGREWVRRMSGIIHAIDPVHPVTCGLHSLNLFEDNGLRVNDVFSELDIAVMHGYPMYTEWARDPLDADFVPFLCALTTALCGKATLMEEFGGPTNYPAEPSTYWNWTGYGKSRRQFMPSELALADYFDKVLPKLLQVGALGAVLWCFADYDAALYGRPPCDEMQHERFFGIVRPDGSLKPHAEVIKRFANTQPLVQPATNELVLDLSPQEYYQEPQAHARRLYDVYLNSLEGAPIG